MFVVFSGSIPRLIATVSSVGLTVLYTHQTEDGALLSPGFVAGNLVVLAAVVLYNQHALCPAKHPDTLPK